MPQCGPHHAWCAVGGCVCCAVRLCLGERSDGLLVAWRLYECVLILSSTLWLLPFTLLQLHVSTCMHAH